MDIRCVVLSAEQQEILFRNGWIPEELDLVTDQNTLFFGGIDEAKNLQAIAVYTFSKANRRNATLAYVYVTAKSRGQGIGTKLLALCGEQLKLMGTKKLTCEWQGSEEELERATYFLENAGFSATMEAAPVVEYVRGQFQGSGLDKLKETQPEVWNSMIYIENYRDKLLQKLLAKQEVTGFYIAESDYRPELCRFYLEDGEIKGAACMRQTKKGDLVTMKGYLSPTLKNKYAMTLLVAAQISDLRNALEPGTKIYLKLYRRSFYDNVKKLFGDGQTEFLFQEYECEMGGI